jgi:hypothetical protein
MINSPEEEKQTVGQAVLAVFAAFTAQIAHYRVV